MKQFDKIKELMGRVAGNKKSKRILFGVAGLILFSIAAAFMFNNSKKIIDPYTTLFSGLSSEEASEVMVRLDESGISYQYQPSGLIRVPTEVADKTRATLAVAGYPKNGFTYDTFLNNSNMMSTEADKKSLKIWEMQDRLAATIRCIDGVKEAIVQIAPGENQKYVLDDSGVTVPTASVMVTMSDGTSPTKEQVLGIQRLVSKSVADMDMGDVAVIDGNGIDVSIRRNDASSPAGDAKMEFEEKVQQQVESNILNLLEYMYGRNNVKVSAKCTADMQKMISEESAYTAPNTEQNAGYITRQALSSDSNGGTGTGGIPGANTNANVPQYNTQAGNTQNNASATSDTDFALNLKKTQSQDDSASIADLTVAISINVANLGIDRQELLNLIANAAGIAPENQGTKISIVNSEWLKTAVVDDNNQQEEDPGKTADVPPKKTSYLPIIIGASIAVFLLIVIIVLLLVRRRRKKRARELDALMQSSMAAEMDEQQQLLKGKIVPVVTEEDERDQEMKANIREFAQDNPEISAQLLKNWLRGDEDNV